jgi:hypothetical protein
MQVTALVMSHTLCTVLAFQHATLGFGTQRIDAFLHTTSANDSRRFDVRLRATSEDEHNSRRSRLQRWFRRGSTPDARRTRRRSRIFALLSRLRNGRVRDSTGLTVIRQEEEAALVLPLSMIVGANGTAPLSEVMFGAMRELALAPSSDRIALDGSVAIRVGFKSACWTVVACRGGRVRSVVATTADPRSALDGDGVSATVSYASEEVFV